MTAAVMRSLIASVALVGCGPVLLGEEVGESFDDAASSSDAARASDGGATTSARPEQPDATAARKRFNVLINVSPPDCNSCYRLQAAAVGGEEPVRFTWEDNSTDPERIVCATGLGTDVFVVATDAGGTESDATVVRLNPREEPCPPPPEVVCLENPSFEGRAAVNLGLPGTFDILPWRACTNPAATNTPDVASEALSASVPDVFVMPVKASNGTTYVAMTENEQVSQMLCKEVAGGAELNLYLDLARANIATGAAPAGTIALEIWGGIGADCSRRELLWASPPADVGWHTYCATLRPIQYMDSLFLRVIIDRAQANATYLLVDNLQPVDSCT